MKSEFQGHANPRAERAAKQLIGAAIAVHEALGPGLPEQCYENALSLELEARNIPFERQRSFQVKYRDQAVGEGRTDFVIDEVLIVELKAVEQISDVHRAQVRGYLRALVLELGLLVNFNTATVVQGIRRILNSSQHESNTNCMPEQSE